MSHTLSSSALIVLTTLSLAITGLTQFVSSSPEGNLLHTKGREGHQPGMFYCPRGVAVTPNRRLVCVSENKNYGLQIS